MYKERNNWPITYKVSLNETWNKVSTHLNRIGNLYYIQLTKIVGNITCQKQESNSALTISCFSAGEIYHGLVSFTSTYNPSKSIFVSLWFLYRKRLFLQDSIMHWYSVEVSCKDVTYDDIFMMTYVFHYHERQVALSNRAIIQIT